MTREHEVISSMSSVPERVFGGDDSDVIRDKLSKRGDVICVWLV